MINQIFLYFGDIKPSTRPKLLSILNDVHKLGMLKIELAATVDWGEPFVKACYHLEGDGPLVLDCFEVIYKVIAGVNANHAPNVEAIARSLTGAPPSNAQCQQWID